MCVDRGRITWNQYQSRKRQVNESDLEVDTQSAGFFRRRYTLHHAYPRVEGSWECQKRPWDTHRRTHNARNHVWLLVIFCELRGGGVAAVGEPRSAAKAAGDTREARLSRPMAAAALLHHHSRLERRLAAPGLLAAAGSACAGHAAWRMPSAGCVQCARAPRPPQRRAKCRAALRARRAQRAARRRWRRVAHGPGSAREGDGDLRATRSSSGKREPVARLVWRRACARTRARTHA